MRSLLLSLLCAAPLVVGYGSYDVAQPAPITEPAVQAEEVYLTSMGCDLVDCTDPAHYHNCVFGCTEPGHYHDCPVGCADPTHPHCGQCWETAPQAGSMYCPSMGCDLADCTDPAHYHNCVFGCTEPGHYHDCPVGCVDPTHPHCGQCWETASQAGSMYRPGMGCRLADCTDPAHYHDCPADCADPAHYHDCPLGCQNAGHAHGGGHRGRGHGHHGWRR